MSRKITSEEKEKEAILKVIKEETDAFDAIDFDRQAKTIVQDETLQRWQNSKNLHWIGSGWKDRGATYKTRFEERPTPGTV